MKVAVTGGAGQLGTVLIKRLLRDRNIREIRCLDLRLPSIANARVRNIQIDIQNPDIGEFLEDCSVLFHLAFVVTRYLPWEEYRAINVLGSQNLFFAAKEAGIQTIVYASSVAAYGEPESTTPCDEETPRQYVRDFPYSATKYEVESFLDIFDIENPEISIARMRPAILLGTRMEHPLGYGLKKRFVLAFGQEKLPLVWDEDVADAFYLAYQKKARGAFNLWGGALSLHEIAEKGDMKLFYVPRKLVYQLAKFTLFLHQLGLIKKLDHPSWLQNRNEAPPFPSEKAKEILGWNPSCESPDDMIQKIVTRVPIRLHPKLALFFRLFGVLGKYGPPRDELNGLSIKIHILITGIDGGDIGLLIRDNRLLIQFDIPRPPDAVLTIKSSHLLDLFSGNLDFSVAQLTGKIRVEGEALSLMVLNGIVSFLRAGREAKGFAGFLGRRFSNWLGKDGSE